MTTSQRRIALLTGASLPAIGAAGEPCNTARAFGLGFLLLGDGPADRALKRLRATAR